MSRVPLRMVGCVVAASVCVATRGGAEPPCHLGNEAVWQPQAVRWPVVPDAVEPVAPWISPSVAEHTDPVDVTTSRAAALWIPAATVKRVRVVRGELADLRLTRVGGSLGAKVTSDEVGVAISGAIDPTPHSRGSAVTLGNPWRGTHPGRAGVIDIAEPVGPGSMWVIAARVPTMIVVERVERREPRLAWEAARDALHAWIDRSPHGGALPELPMDDGGGAAIRLLGSRALLAAGQSSVVRAAIQLWRRTQADAIIATLRPGHDPYVAHDERLPEGLVTMDADDDAYGPSPVAGRPWRLQLTGPGVLVIDARATAAEAVAGGSAVVEVRREGATMVRVTDAVGPVAEIEPGAALPATALDAGQAPGSGVLGRKIRAVVPLALGTHAYEIAVTGAGLVRADVRRRRSRLREWFSDRPQRKAQWLAAKLTTIADPNERAIAEWLIASVLGSRSVTTRSATTPATMLAQLVATPGQVDPALAPSLVAKVAALVRQSHGDLGRAVVLELAERIPDGVDATPVAESLLASGETPPPVLLAALAPHLHGGGRSDGLAAAELAWRQRPTASAFRSSLLAVARRMELRRVDPVLDGTTPIEPARWLTVRAANRTSGTERSRMGGAIEELELGRDREIDVAPHPNELERLGVVRVYVATSADAPGPVRITFDGGSQSLLALRSLEVVEMAASAGRHTVRVDAPSTTRVFVSTPRRDPNQPEEILGGMATVVRRWPVDEAVAYTLPTPRAIGPIRIEFIGLSASPQRSRRHVVWLHSESGPPRRLVLDVRGLDPTSWPLDDERTFAPPAAIWTWLPPATRTFWLTTDDGPLYARVSVHGPVTVTAAAVPVHTAPPLPRTVGLDRVAELSASIAAQADASQNYVARALALLEVGEIGSARRDLAAAGLHMRAEHRGAHDDARAVFDAVADPSYLPVQPPDGPIRSGVAIGSPSIPAEDGLVSLVRRIRRDGAATSWAAVERGDIAIPPGSAGKHLAALLAQRAGQSRAAVERWLAIGSWPANVAALVELRVLLDRGTTAVAPLALGVASELENIVLPVVRHARATAARASRWEPVRHTARNAGFESLSTTPNQLDESPAVALQRALLGAPWRDAPAVLEPGRATIFPVDGPRTIGVQVWCRRLWPADLPSECRLTSALDQAVPTPMVVPHGRVHQFVVDVPAGHHEIEIGLGPDDSTAVAAVRFTDGSASASDPAIPVLRPTRVFLAAIENPGSAGVRSTPDDPGKSLTRDQGVRSRIVRPAEVVVSGPGAIGVEVRGYLGGTETADIAVVGPDGERRVGVVLDRAAAPETVAAPGRAVSVTRPVMRTVLLPTPGTFTIRVTPSRDIVAVRFATRVATDRGPDLVADPPVEVAGDGLPWPTAIPQPMLVAGRDPSPRWIPSVEGVVGQDNLAALDTDFAELDVRFELAAQLRRRDRDRSWFAELRGRRAGPLGPTARLRAAGEFRGLPLGVTASIDARAAVQTWSGGSLWLARAAGDVARPLLLSPRWQLVPQLSLYAAAFTPAVVPFGADPMVANSYRRDRPLQLAQSLDLHGRPWADQFLAVGLTMRSNDSLASIDAVGAQVMWRGLVEASPRRGGIVMLEYAPTLRLANNHRAYTFVRHDLAAELSWPWSIARGRYGRIALALRGDLYPPTNISQMAHAVTFRLRWDGWHPGERNRMPSEEPLSDFIDEVSWAGRR